MATPAGTFVFADIAGFTALTEVHGDEAAAALVDTFCSTVARLLPPGGEHVKTIGDAVMLRIPQPADAIRLGVRLAAPETSEDGAGAAVRVGIHHGPAIARDGDYFGATVNLAARVSSVAAGGEALVTGETAALAPDLDGIYYEARGRHVLRNIREPVELFSALRIGTTSGHLPVDPVCSMLVDPERAPGRLVFAGEAYFFCSLACAGIFARDPERFAASGGEP